MNTSDYHVLLVDHDTANLDNLEGTVRALGFVPVRVPHPTNAVASAREVWERGGVSAAIVHLSVKGQAADFKLKTTGLELVEWMHRTRPDGLVVTISSDNVPSDESDVRARGGAAHFVRGANWHPEFDRLARDHAATSRDLAFDFGPHPISDLPPAADEPDAPDPGDYDRVRADADIRRDYGGQVVAVYRGEVIAAGESARDAGARAAAAGYADALALTFVPVPILWVKPARTSTGV